MKLLKDKPLRTLISSGIHQVENIFLLVIALFTVAAMFQEIYAIVLGLSVTLKDLLLMFIYVEVIAMVGAYYESKRIPIHTYALKSGG